jgi:peptide-methionine (S)-S-oxide reductase
MHIASEKFVASAVAAGVVGVLLFGLATIRSPAVAAVGNVAVPAMIESPGVKPVAPVRSETVVFAGGCFWGVQGVFEHVKGVRRAVSGYIGGSAMTAHYEIVGTGQTGHAEAVQVTFDPSQVSYAQLMRVFFSVVHDPTQLNYQGPDHGTQYRSAIYTTTPAQLRATTTYIAQLTKAGTFRAPIVTKVETAKPFYPAERHHQDYMALNPDAAYIRYWDAPKVEALREHFPTLYRATPVLLTQR